MGAGRPPKKGLSYHRSDVDYYEDFKIIDLMDRYGPLGQTIYDVILKMVYRSGYYLEIPMNNLALSVTKTIGNKWIRNKDLVLQVVQYCADIGLFDDALLQQSVITSAGIQKRYELVTVRNKVNKEKYWLLDEESPKPLESASKNGITDAETVISVTEIRNTDAEIPINKRKENNIYDTVFQPEELESAFQLYLLVRKHNYGEIPAEQIRALRDEVLGISEDWREQLEAVKKAASGGYKTIYKIRKDRPEKPEGKRKPVPKKDRFNNFTGREYDMGTLEKQLLGVEAGRRS